MLSKQKNRKRKFVFQWHITHKCNLRCKHCYQEEYCKDLDREELINIFYEIKKYVDHNEYFGHINFTGGEPMVSENMWTLFDLCDKNNMTFGVLTNGTLIDEQVAGKLAKYKGIRFVQVSIDGVKETHDSIRGEGSFEKAFNGLMLLKNVGIQTMVSFTCSKTNYRELKDVIRICEKKRVDRFWTDRLVPIGGNQLDIVSIKEYKKYLRILGKESRRAARNPFIKTRVHTNRALQFMCGCVENSYMCSAGRGLLTILADGTLLPCRRLPLELGNLTEKSVADIVEGNEIIEKLNEFFIPTECRSCKYKCNCKGGARCITYAVTGKLDEKDINCPFSKEKNRSAIG